jgi:hypothetical protein
MSAYGLQFLTSTLMLLGLALGGCCTSSASVPIHVPATHHGQGGVVGCILTNNELTIEMWSDCTTKDAVRVYVINAEHPEQIIVPITRVTVLLSPTPTLVKVTLKDIQRARVLEVFAEAQCKQTNTVARLEGHRCRI